MKNSKKPIKRKQPPSADKLKKVKYESIREENHEKQNKSSLYGAPTVEELNQLKETENLYNNNLFRLQISELLTEIQIKNKRKKVLDDTLLEIRTLLSKSQPETYILSKIEEECPLKTDQDITIKFKPPTATDTFGLYEINALMGPDLECNLSLQMPKDGFNVRDYLNNRYLVKKWMYLRFVASKLKELDIKWNYQRNNKLLSHLTINKGRVTVNLFATPPDDYFKPARFLPNVNNMKINLFPEFQFEDEESLKEIGTVYYNSALLHDVTLTRNWNFIRSTLEDQKNVQEALKIIQVWLKQRKLENLTTFCVFLVVYLFVKKRINSFMSSYQIVRNFWSFLNAGELQKDICHINSTNSEHLSLFNDNFDVVLLDESGCFNVASFINKAMHEKLKSESDIALKLLDASDISTFESLFINKVPEYLQYDLILRIDDPVKLKHFPDITDAKKAKYFGFERLLIETCLLEWLRKGLNERASNIVPINGDSKGFKFGLTLNPDTAFNFLELGPPLNELKEAEEFRRFWGKLATDRRFRDGSAKVAVYFKTSTIREKRSIIKKIIDFLLNEKLKINQYTLHYDEYEEVIVNKKIRASYPLGSNEEASLKVVTVADELGKKIRGLEMSLSVTGLNGLSDVFSYTDVFPPISTTYEMGHLTTVSGENFVFKDHKIGMVPRFVPVIESLIQLEHSSKWPSDLQAIRHIKTLFYLEMSKLLKEQHQITSHASKEYLEVFFEGFVFRYKLHIPKEIGLMKKEVTVNGVVSYKDTEETFEMEKMNLWATVNGSLKGIQSQYPSYGPGTALIKRWMRAQLIDDHLFPDNVINLLNASLYTNCTSYSGSNTPQIAFWRFLKFIADLQSDLQAVVLNFNEELTKPEISEIEAKVQQNREAFAPLYIIMPYDKGESIFTKHAPSKCILHRIKELAKVTLNFLEDSERIKDMFVPNLVGYNVMIHLKPLMNSRRHEQCVGNENVAVVQLNAFDVKKSCKIPIVNFNPIESYLKELRRNYGEFAHFFHDSYGGNKIAVLWNPKAMEKKPVKVSYMSGRKVNTDHVLEFNEDAILEDFYILGKDLVKLIEKC